MHNHILEEFNRKQYAIPSINELFDIEIIQERQPRSASVAALLRAKSNQQASYNISFKIFDMDYPVPLLKDDNNNLFGNLFGVIFREKDTNEALC